MMIVERDRQRHPTEGNLGAWGGFLGGLSTVERFVERSSVEPTSSNRMMADLFGD